MQALMRSVNCGMLTIRAYSVVLGMNQPPWMICLIMSLRLTVMTFIIQQVLKFVKFYLPCVITKLVTVMGYMLKTISWQEISTTVSWPFCFNIMFTHGYIPVAATQTIICPCIKDKTVICLKSLIIDLLLWLLSFPKFMNIYF